ncbi:hypothetical protein EUGRSUZ_E00953 [Eucalyptus grandis]|uniref:Uncharacterized protein n=2 Tax=Eucalyptus grandis TaxID=71139 RepID=A0ACC3KRM9_EUCGR|nr:hypothetical protein EUGRSUZ_E00953 [Eucalyptus grandis]
MLSRYIQQFHRRCSKRKSNVTTRKRISKVYLAALHVGDGDTDNNKKYRRLGDAKCTVHYGNDRITSPLLCNASASTMTSSNTTSDDSYFFRCLPSAVFWRHLEFAPAPPPAPPPPHGARYKLAVFHE